MTQAEGCEGVPCLSVCLSACSPIYLSTHLSVCLLPTTSLPISDLAPLYSYLTDERQLAINYPLIDIVLQHAIADNTRERNILQQLLILIPPFHLVFRRPWLLNILDTHSFTLVVNLLSVLRVIWPPYVHFLYLIGTGISLPFACPHIHDVRFKCFRFTPSHIILLPLRVNDPILT